MNQREEGKAQIPEDEDAYASHFKEQRLFEKAAAQHVRSIQQRQTLAIELFERLGVSFRGLRLKASFEIWWNVVQIHESILVEKEELLVKTLAGREELRRACEVLVEHWSWVSLCSQITMMSRWKEVVNVKCARTGSPFTTTNRSQELSNQHYLDMVHSISTASAENHLPTVYDRIIQSAMELSDAETAVLFRVDSLSGSLSPVGISDYQGEHTQTASTSIFPDDPCVLGLVSKQHCIYLSSDVLQDNHYSPGLDRVGIAGLVVRNLVCLPFFVDTSTTMTEEPMFDLASIDEGRTMPTKPGRMIAMLYLINKRKRYGNAFTSSDVINLLTVLQSAPTAIVACQKFIDQGVYVSRLDGLTNMARMDSRVITLELLTERLVTLSGAVRGTVFCVDEVKEELFFQVDTAVGTKREIRIPLTSNSIAGYSIIEQVTINIPDCYRDHRFNPSTDRATGFKTNQMLCVPLTNHEGKAIGAIQLINSRRGMSFDENDQKLLHAFAVYVQAAIENLRNKGAVECIYKQVAKSVHLNSMLANTFNGKDLLEIAFRETCLITGCSYMSVYIPSNNEPVKDKYLLHNNKGAWSEVVTIQPTTMLKMAAERQFVNACVTNETVDKNGCLELVDVFHGVKGRRGWVGSMVGKKLNGEEGEPVTQALGKEIRCLQDVDFPRKVFEEDKWTNILMIPIPTAEGCFMLQLAGKSDAQCFSVADEELLVMVGQQLVVMIKQHCYIDFMNGDGKPVTKMKYRAREDDSLKPDDHDALAEEAAR